MLVVLDPGVFVSAAVTPGGVASQVVLAGIEGRYEYLLCPHLIDELTEVLGRPKIARRVTEESAQRFLIDIVAAGHEVADPVDVTPLSRDPDDDYLLALATENAAELVVTGDADLLEVPAPSVPVLSVRAFLDRLGTDAT